MAGVVVSLAVCLLGLLVVYRCLAAWGLRAPGSLARHAVEEGPPAAQGLQPGWKIFLLGAGSRVGLLLAGMAAAMLLSDGGLTWEGAFQQLQRWDAAHYIRLIEEGYQGYTENGQHLFLVFFPGYVWAARDALLYMSLFPFSFFSGLVMTEGLFLLATTGACWYAWRGKWLAFGLFGALAALTRMTGLLVIAVGVIRLLEAYRPLEPPVGKSLGRCWKPLLLGLPLTLLPAAGTLLYLLLNLWVDGDPFAFASHQEHWHQGYLWISQVVEYIGRYLGDNLGSSYGWAVWAPALALFVVGLALLYWAALRKGHPAGLLAYGFCFFVATYSLSWLLSAGRYLSTCFVLFLFLAKLTQRRPALRAALLGGEGVLLGVYLCAFLAGAQVM